MIYTCQHCGGWFDSDYLNDAITNNQSTIKCKYCGNINDIGRMKTSHIAKGYDHLEVGDFYGASMEFGEAIKTAQHLDMAAKSPFLEAYLGHALAQFSVQVVYEDEIADKNHPPEVTCYLCNDMRFEDCREFQIALEITNHIVDDSLRSLERNRVLRFARIIDGIKDIYDAKAREDVKYQLFVAYEDKSADAKIGLTMANKIRNLMPSEIKRIFLPEIENFNDDEILYEAEILYAIHNSTCMLVVTDDDIDARLMKIYSRYYWARSTSQDKFKKELGFVRFKNKIQIHLPDHKISNNIFEIDNESSFVNFVAASNGIIRVVGPIEDDEDDIIKEITSNKSVNVQIEDSGDPDAPRIVGHRCVFGSYPQRLERDVAIINQFNTIQKPTPSSDNGWNVMFKTKSGKPYTWYLDKEIDGKKYRAIFFMKFRDVLSLHDSDIKPSIQRIANYMPMRIHVFAFEPIVWNILDLSMKNAVLISSMGIDCREFNNCELCADYDCSTIKSWLNEDFLSVAFNEGQRDYIFTRDDERVFLMDSDLDLTKKQYRTKIETYNINGSDYFKCIGGFCDRNVANFWIKAPCEFDDKASAMMPHSPNNLIPQFVDNTAVSVVPKIIVRLDSSIEG